MTRFSLDSEIVEVVDSTKLLGTTITNDLKWELNTATIIKKANARLELLRKVASFGAPIEDLKTVYILFIRSLLEQSAVVWHSSLTQENANDLERVQKSAFKIILQNSNLKYKEALQILQLETLSDRRENLCLKFAQTCTKNPKFQDMFPKNPKSLNMTLRNPEIYKIEKANTERYTKSPIIYMQKLLNRHCVNGQ